MCKQETCSINVKEIKYTNLNRDNNNNNNNKLDTNEIEFQSDHEVFGIFVSSSIILEDIETKTDSILKSEIYVSIPKLSIKFGIINNFTFDNNKK